MRLLRWSFILFQCFWLNAVVPGHTRGAFAMPGSKPVGAAPVAAATVVEAKSGGCCATRRATPQKSEPTDQPLDRGRCAVCHYALGLTLPPVFSVDHRPAGLAGLAPVPAMVSGFIADLSLTTHPRGPPAAHA